MPEMTMLNIQ